MKGIQRKSFEFRVKGPKKRGRILLTVNFHPNAQDITLRRMTYRAALVSGDRNPKFIGVREPVTLRGR